jgi:hypothetical protein
VLGFSFRVGYRPTGQDIDCSTKFHDYTCVGFFSFFFLYILHLFLNNYCAACLEVLKKKLLAAWKKFLAAGMNLGGCYQGSDE